MEYWKKAQYSSFINKLVSVSPMEGFRSSTVDSVIMPFTPNFQVPHPPPSSSHHHHHQPVAAVAMAQTTSANASCRKRNRQMDPTLERDRRFKMSQMFAELQSTVPNLFSKATREVIVNETINYIKDLEKKKKRLEELIKDCCSSTMMIEEAASNNNNNSSNIITVTLSAANNVAFFGIQSKAKPGLLTLIFKVFFNHNAEILSANVSVNNGDLTLAITALLPHNNNHINGGDDDHGNGIAEKIKTEILSL